jgi:hypothetical protein
MSASGRFARIFQRLHARNFCEHVIMPHAYRAAVLAQRTVVFASLIAFEPMGDGQCHRVRASSVRHARQPGIRIDLEGDGDQRQYKNDNNGSHGPVCRGRIRPNRSNKRENGSFISEYRRHWLRTVKRCPSMTVNRHGAIAGTKDDVNEIAAAVNISQPTLIRRYPIVPLSKRCPNGRSCRAFGRRDCVGSFRPVSVRR